MKKQSSHQKNKNSSDEVALSEPCPCGSKKLFGHCCGFDFPCDCKSHLPAEECCYPNAPAPSSKK